jgi:mono/diheme cytochrome c family protein
MKTWIRWSLGGIAGLLTLAAAALAAGHVVAAGRLQRQIKVDVPAVALRDDAAGIERGRYLYASRGCVDCHGADGAGRQFLDTPMLRVRGPNITPGAHSVTRNYSTTDWVRAVRHGVKPDGRPTLIMPSEDYNRFTDADMGALAAYLRQLPAVAGQPAQLELSLPVRLMYAAGMIQDAAAKIDHSQPPEQPVAEGPTVEHGRYVAKMCTGCHGGKLDGGKIAGAPPDWPAAAQLTPGEASVMKRYPDVASFQAMMRSGRRPDGSAVAVMPFESLSHMSETDTAALHAYLHSLAPRQVGSR